MSDTKKAVACPTCSTCPFWYAEGDDTEPLPVGHPGRAEWDGDAECHAAAPTGRMEKHGGPLFVDDRRYSYAWPRTHAADFCGKHPSMKDYIRKQRS